MLEFSTDISFIRASLMAAVVVACRSHRRYCKHLWHKQRSNHLIRDVCWLSCFTVILTELTLIVT